MTNPAAPAPLALALLALLAAASAASAAERPSFDCAKAASASERAICTNARLARLDREIAAAYRRLMPKLGNENKALPNEQKDFLAKRDACGANASCLAAIMEERRAALALERKPASDPRSAFAGFYKNRIGEMLVRRTLDGRFVLSGSTAEPTSGRWICDVSGELRALNNGVARVEIGEADDLRHVTIRMRGGQLVVTEDEERRLAGIWCGANGYIEGTYRRVPLR